MLLSCAEVRERLQEYHDRELSIAEQIAVESHLTGCPPCASGARQLARIGEALRIAASDLTRDETASLASGVLSRLSAERHEALPARVGRMFEDMHLVWAGLGATAATIVCMTLVLGILRYASPERADSLSAVLQILGSPGSNENPVVPDARMQLPRVHPDVMPAMLIDSLLQENEDDAYLALAAVVTREGRVSDVLVLRGNEGEEALTHMLSAASAARFEPAHSAGSPVAVNLIWLLAHTTVRGS